MRSIIVPWHSHLAWWSAVYSLIELLKVSDDFFECHKPFAQLCIDSLGWRAQLLVEVPPVWACLHSNSKYRANNETVVRAQRDLVCLSEAYAQLLVRLNGAPQCLGSEVESTGQQNTHRSSQRRPSVAVRPLPPGGPSFWTSAWSVAEASGVARRRSRIFCECTAHLDIAIHVTLHDCERRGAKQIKEADHSLSRTDEL